MLEFRLSFFGSVLGYLWQLDAAAAAVRRPLRRVHAVRSRSARACSTTRSLLLIGHRALQFFAEATGDAVTAVLDRENLVRKIHFPRLVIPLSVVLTALFNLGLNLRRRRRVLRDLRASPARWSAGCELPLLLGCAGVFAFGLAMLLSALFVRYRDVQPIWDVVLQIDVLRVADPLPDRARPVEWLQRRSCMCNPLAVVLAAGPPRDDRPGGAERRRGDRRRAGTC